MNAGSAFAERIDDETELRPIAVGDAPALFAVVESCRSYLDEWIPWVGAIRSPREMGELIRARILQSDGRGPQFCMLDRGVVVGWIGYTHLDWDASSVEIEYWIGQAFQGRGTVTKCCRYLTDYAFDQLALERVIICTAEENTYSMRIPLKLGFRREKVLEKADRIHGREINLVLFSKCISGE